MSIPNEPAFPGQARAAPATARATVERYARHVSPTLVKVLGLFGFGRVFVGARDVWVWDSEGRRYLDFNAGFGAVNLGHNHPRLVERLRGFLAEQALNFCHLGPAPQAAELAEALCARLGEPLSVCTFSNGGAEAVEAGLKLARVATGRPGFLYCQGGYHGLNLGTLSVMGDEHLRQPLEPLLPHCRQVPFGDLAALKAGLESRQAAAFLVEPVQCEGGINLPPPGYLAEAQRLCREYGTLLVLDEVQTGLGRTGRLSAFQGEGFVPDVLVLAKSLSGGLAPIGATLTSAALNRRAYGSLDHFELPFSTFGGNALSCVTGLETLKILDEEGLVANGAARGEQLLWGLRERLAGHPLVRDVRGGGLLVGVEFGPTGKGAFNRLCPGLVRAVMKGLFGHWVTVRLLERGILCAHATHRWDVLRLEPPLTVTEEHVRTAIDAVAEVVWQYRGVRRILRETTGRLGRQWARRWEF